MVPNPVRFEIDDTIILPGHLYGSREATPDLCGRVERTYHALDSHDPLQDCLIIAYVPVPTPIIQDFAASGRPPKGYVFVEFALEECGHALLPEEAIILLSRAFAIGDTVKQDANRAMFGTVIDIRSAYFLSPVCRHSATPEGGDGRLEFIDLLDTHPVVENDCVHMSDEIRLTIPDSIIRHEFTKDDIRRAEDFAIGDHIVSRDWFGTVEAADNDVAVLLDNHSVVWVARPWELEIVVRNPHERPLVTLPEFDSIRRPDILNAQQNGITSMAPTRFSRGDAIVSLLP